jgi:hypothetical protein
LDLRTTLSIDIHYLHLFADGILDELCLGQIQSREGIRILKTEDGKLFGDRKIVLLFSPRKADEIDLLALAAMEAGLKVIPSPKVDFDRGFQPNEPSRSTIPVVGTKCFIQITTNRLLTKDGKKLDPEAFDSLIPLRTLPSLNEALQNDASDLNQVLLNLKN